jgi:hypothetical protein
MSHEEYTRDFMKCLNSFAVKGISSKRLVKAVSSLVSENIEHMSAETSEFFLYFID